MRYALLQGDALARLRELPDESAQCVVTSPPCWEQSIPYQDYSVNGMQLPGTSEGQQ